MVLGRLYTPIRPPKRPDFLGSFRLDLVVSYQRLATTVASLFFGVKSLIELGALLIFIFRECQVGGGREANIYYLHSILPFRIEAFTFCESLEKPAARLAGSSTESTKIWQVGILSPEGTGESEPPLFSQCSLSTRP
jgi:hypothetical protein